MSEAVWVAIIVQTGGIIAAAFVGGKKLNRIGGDAKEAREQTANTHTTNLRDDIDDVKGAVKGIERTVTRLSDWATDLTNADLAIERTLDRKTLANEREIARVRDENAAHAEKLRRDLLEAIDQKVTPPDQ